MSSPYIEQYRKRLYSLFNDMLNDKNLSIADIETLIMDAMRIEGFIKKGDQTL